MGISSLQGHLGAMQYYEKNPGWKDGIRGPGQVPPRLWASFPDGERSGWEFQFLGHMETFNDPSEGNKIYRDEDGRS